MCLEHINAGKYLEHVLHLLAIYVYCEWKHLYGISENTQELTTRATQYYIYLIYYIFDQFVNNCYLL